MPVRIKRLSPRSVVYEQGGYEVEKFIKGPYTQDQRHEFFMALAKKGREAVRDIAYMKHGEAWREHVEWGGFFDAPTAEELRMIEDALA